LASSQAGGGGLTAAECKSNAASSKRRSSMEKLPKRRNKLPDTHGLPLLIGASLGQPCHPP
jgi:hypothetical protein